MTDRIAILEAKIAEAQAELAELKRGDAPKPVPQRDERPLMSYLTPPSNFVRPTSKELRLLCDVVVSKYPKIGPRHSLRGLLNDELAADFYDGFVWSFEGLGYMGRTAPDTKHYVDHWADAAKDWLALHRPSHTGNISAAFLAAIVAHGDIPFIVGDMSRGIVWSVGLTTYGGKLASDAWKRVLNGELLEPTLLARSAAPSHPVRMYGF